MPHVNFCEEWKMAAIELGFSRDSIELSARSDHWREVNRPVFDIGVSRGIQSSAAYGEGRGRSNGELLIYRSTFSEQQFLRSEKKLRLSGMNSYLLQLLTAGDMRGSAGNNHVEVQTGDLHICDLGRTSTNYASAGSRLTMMIERERLERLVGRTDLHGVVLRRFERVTCLLTDFMAEILNVSLNLSPAEAALAVDVVGRLVKGGVTGATQMHPEEESMYLATLRTKILAHIDAHLERPDLSTTTLMERFCISRAGLYRALEVDGGVAKVIRDRRLNAAFELLSRRGDMAISQIAYNYGFSSPQQFFKAFHRKFGVAPSEARELDSGNIAAPNISTLLSHLLKSVPHP